MPGPSIKICGVTTRDALSATIEARASHVGFNFFPPSPRFLPPVGGSLNDLRWDQKTIKALQVAGLGVAAICKIGFSETVQRQLHGLFNLGARLQNTNALTVELGDTDLYPSSKRRGRRDCDEHLQHVGVRPKLAMINEHDPEYHPGNDHA